jgi:phospholipid transport system substrate-binding protein
MILTQLRTGLFLRGVLALALLFGLAATRPATAETPVVAQTVADAGTAAMASKVVERLNATLLKIMQNADRLGYAGRYAEMAPTVSESFDIPFMAQQAAGSYWKSLTEAQRKSLADAFGQFTIASYAARFNAYSGQKFEVLSEAPGAANSMMVRNQLVKGNGEAISIDYALKQNSGKWRIVDVYLKGRFSELAVRRGEYTSAIKSQGIVYLIEQIEGRVTALRDQATQKEAEKTTEQ